MSTGSSPRIVIIGAGPTGLGAAHRLQELSYDDWVLLEADDRVGGLAKSYVDDDGFTWDIGGHVMFSHYEYYDRLIDTCSVTRSRPVRSGYGWRTTLSATHSR